MNSSTPKAKITIKELVIFAMLGAVMFCGDVLMEMLPNIHLVGVLTVVFTLVYRVKALIPIYLYVFITWLVSGLSLWVLPYWYIWLILWAIIMVLPKKMPIWLQWGVYPVVCMIHGLSFGTLYAPVQAFLFKYNWDQTLVWIINGFTFDILHAVGNFAGGLLIIPLVAVLKKLNKQAKI